MQERVAAAKRKVSVTKTKREAIAAHKTRIAKRREKSDKVYQEMRADYYKHTGSPLKHYLNKRKAAYGTVSRTRPSKKPKD